MLQQKTCNKYKEEAIRKVMEDIARVEDELNENEAYGGYEGKIEKGNIVHFKYWVNKKIKI